MKAKRTTALIRFDATRDADGKIRTKVWDRICVPTGEADVKDGQETEFSVENLSELVDNFVERGDEIPMDHGHQTNHAANNGKPAPALAFYGAFAVVDSGAVVKTGKARGIEPEGLEGLDPARDGLWGYRSEVTELGQEILSGFKYVSPTFTSQGTRRNGSDCGYSIIAVAATNSPFQEGTQITFEQPVVAPVVPLSQAGGDAGASEAATPLEEKRTPMDPKLLARLGLAEDASPEDCNAAMAKCMDESDAMKMAAAAKMEGDEDMSKLEADKDESEKFEKDDDEKDDEKDDKGEAKMATLEATVRAMGVKLAKFEASEKAREKAETTEREARFEALATLAIAGGYPKEQKGALVKFARSDFAAAHATVSPFLPKGSAPAHLFDRLSKAGGPAASGASSSVREIAAGPVKPIKISAMGRHFVEDDGAFAAEVERIADSKDPAIAAKLDKYIPVANRAVKFDRLMAAEKVVRAERPELIADGE